MPDIETRFLFLYAGFPSIAYAPSLTRYDRAVAEQIARAMGQVSGDVELDEALEDQMLKDDDKYGYKWGM